MVAPASQVPHGAYGLRRPDLDGAARWMQAQPPDAPSLRLGVEEGRADDSPSRIDEHSADFGSSVGRGRASARPWPGCRSRPLVGVLADDLAVLEDDLVLAGPAVATSEIP